MFGGSAMDEKNAITLHIDEKKEKALEMILKGEKDTNIAARLRISRMTLYRWRRDDVYFIEALTERRGMMMEQATEGLMELTEMAIEAIRRALTEGDLKTQLQAAKLVLQMAERTSEKNEKSSPMIELLSQAIKGIEGELGLKNM
jgi:transposase-like protein